MKLPNAAQALVAKAKIIEYLLSGSHPRGRGKARFFLAHGFETSDWERLAAALLRHAVVHPVTSAVETAFGIRYVVDGALESPDGRLPVVRAVWFVGKNRRTPELVTAYPVGRRSQ